MCGFATDGKNFIVTPPLSRGQFIRSRRAHPWIPGQARDDEQICGEDEPR